MVLDLISIGVSVVSLFAKKGIENLASAAAYKLEPYAINSEVIKGLQTVLQKDIEQLKMQITSLAEAEADSAVQVLEEALIIIKNDNTETKSFSNPAALEAALKSPEAVPFKISHIVKNKLFDAEKSAIKAFNDKKNIKVLLRLECMKIQIFCTLIRHRKNPKMCFDLLWYKVGHMLSDTKINNLLKLEENVFTSRVKLEKSKTCKRLFPQIYQALYITYMAAIDEPKTEKINSIANLPHIPDYNDSGEKIYFTHFCILNFDDISVPLVTLSYKIESYRFAKFANCLFFLSERIH